MGHEDKMLPLRNMVADYRAATPTAAAVVAVPSKGESASYIESI